MLGDGFLASMPVAFELRLHLLPQINSHEGIMFALIQRALVWQLSDIDWIGEQAIEVPAAERSAPCFATVLLMAHLGAHSSPVQLSLERPNRACFEIEREDLPNLVGFLWVHE